MDYEKLMLAIKNKYFPELKDVKLKPIGKFEMKILRRMHKFTPDMVAYKKAVHYNKSSVKNFNNKELGGIFAHELAHLIQTKKLNWFQQIIFQIKAGTSLSYRSKLEKEAEYAGQIKVTAIRELRAQETTTAK